MHASVTPGLLRWHTEQGEADSAGMGLLEGEVRDGSVPYCCTEQGIVTFFMLRPLSDGQICLLSWVSSLLM